MKNWFSKFRISAELDSADHSKTTEKPITQEDQKWAEFRREMAEIEAELKRPLQEQPAPSGMHSTIMRLVRQESEAGREKSTLSSAVSRWAFAGGLTVILCLSLAKMRTPPVATSADTPLTAAASALDIGRRVTSDAPAQAVAPLSAEMENLNQDLKRTMEFLLASVP